LPKIDMQGGREQRDPPGRSEQATALGEGGSTVQERADLAGAGTQLRPVRSTRWD
jgi:hypothetical protein